MASRCERRSQRSCAFKCDCWLSVIRLRNIFIAEGLACQRRVRPYLEARQRFVSNLARRVDSICMLTEQLIDYVNNASRMIFD